MNFPQPLQRGTGSSLRIVHHTRPQIAAVLIPAVLHVLPFLAGPRLPFLPVSDLKALRASGMRARPQRPHRRTSFARTGPRSRAASRSLEKVDTGGRCPEPPGPPPSGVSVMEDSRRARSGRFPLRGGNRSRKRDLRGRLTQIQRGAGMHMQRVSPIGNTENRTKEEAPQAFRNSVTVLALLATALSFLYTADPAFVKTLILIDSFGYASGLFVASLAIPVFAIIILDLSLLTDHIEAFPLSQSIVIRSTYIWLLLGILFLIHALYLAIQVRWDVYAVTWQFWIGVTVPFVVAAIAALIRERQVTE